MLSAVLSSEIAIAVSIKIMDEFVRMRHIMASSSLLFAKINNIEVKQLLDSAVVEVIRTLVSCPN